MRTAYMNGHQALSGKITKKVAKNVQDHSVQTISGINVKVVNLLDVLLKFRSEKYTRYRNFSATHTSKGKQTSHRN